MNWAAEPYWQWWQAQMAPPEPPPHPEPAQEPAPSEPEPTQAPTRREIPRDAKALRGLDQMKSLFAVVNRGHLRHRR
jgi:hypothetical protein